MPRFNIHRKHHSLLLLGSMELFTFFDFHKHDKKKHGSQTETYEETFFYQNLHNLDLFVIDIVLLLIIMCNVQLRFNYNIDQVVLSSL